MWVKLLIHVCWCGCAVPCSVLVVGHVGAGGRRAFDQQQLQGSAVHVGVVCDSVNTQWDQEST